MMHIAKKIHRFLVREEGPTAVEYAVMLAMIVVLCMIAINRLGTNAMNTFTNTADSLGS
jgi:pilus assembly protein Flp/PilA